MNTQTETSVRNGIRIVKHAIRKNVSLSEASRQFNFGRNYVSDIKSRIKDNYRNRNINRELYNEFNAVIKQYNS